MPWKQTEIILLFLRLHPSTTFWTLVDYEGYSISSKEFLPTVEDIMVIWIKFTHSSSFYKVHWFLKCWCSLLPSPVWLQLIYLNSWAWHSRFLCNVALYSIRLYFHLQSHPWLGIFFSFTPSLHSFWGVHLSVSFLPFHTVHGDLKVRILKWFAILFSNGPCFVRTLHHDLSILGGPTWHGS